MSSLRRQARIAGFGYLLIVAGGVFAQLAVRQSLFHAGDATATASAIAQNELLWRVGIAMHLLYLPVGVMVGVILYRIFRIAHPTLALIALALNLGDIVMEAVLLNRLYVPLTFIEENAALSGLAISQQHAIAYLAIRSFFTGWSFALLLFSGFCMLIGVMILRTRLVPRLVGILMIAAGAAYFLNSTTALLAPAVAPKLAPLLIVSFVGELSFTLWLLVKGVRTEPGYS
jgi:hypothetical protein